MANVRGNIPASGLAGATVSLCTFHLWHFTVYTHSPALSQGPEASCHPDTWCLGFVLPSLLLLLCLIRSAVSADPDPDLFSSTQIVLLTTLCLGATFLCIVKKVSVGRKLQQTWNQFCLSSFSQHVEFSKIVVSDMLSSFGVVFPEGFIDTSYFIMVRSKILTVIGI